jgi:outer membrane receptor protein involved in Fe transport
MIMKRRNNRVGGRVFNLSCVIIVLLLGASTSGVAQAQQPASKASQGAGGEAQAERTLEKRTADLEEEIRKATEEGDTEAVQRLTAALERLRKKEAPFRLPEVVATGRLIQEPARLADPVPQTGVSREEFEVRNNRRAGDIIQRLPGLYLAGPPGERKDIRLRGLDKEFTRTQVDGVQLPDGGEKREFQVNRIPSFMVERIRIIRNPTAEFESDGIAGRVDIQTRPIPTETTVEGRLGYGGSNGLDGDLLNAALGFGYRPTSWFGIVGAFDHLDTTFDRPKQKLFSTGKTEVEDDSERQVSPNLNLDLGFFYGPGEFHLKPLFLNLDKDKNKTRVVREPGKPATRDAEEEVFLQRTWGLGLRHRHTFAGGPIWETLAGFYLTEEDKDKDRLGFKESAGIFAIDKTTLESENKEDQTWNVSTSVAVPFHLGLRQEVKFGGALRFRDRFRDKRVQEIDKAGKLTDVTKPKDNLRLSEDYVAAFVQDTLWLTDRFSMLPGVRLEHVSLASRTGDGTRGSKSVTDANPSLHFLYRLRDDLSLRAAVSRAVNRPKFDELSPFEQEDGKTITIGNPDLDPARSWNVDLGGEFATPHLFLGVNLFYKRISDVIEEVDTGIDKKGKDVFQVQNVGDGWTRGIEFEQRLNLGLTGIDILRGFTLWTNETFLESEVQDATGRKRRFKDQPTFIANAGIDYTFDPWGTTLSLAWNYIGERKDFKPTGDVRTIEPSASLDVAVRQSVYKHLAFFLEADNVTGAQDIEREAVVNGTSSRREEGGGRTFLLGLQGRF